MLESSQKTAKPVKNRAVSKKTGVEQAETASGRRGMDTLERRIAPGAFHNLKELRRAAISSWCDSLIMACCLQDIQAEKDFALEYFTPATWLPALREMMIPKRKSESMIQGKEITISGGKLTNVEGDYHEHNTTYVIEEAPMYRGCLETLKDKFKNLETKVNKLLISSPKEDNMKSDDSNRQTMHSPSRMKNESMGDTSSFNHVTEIRFDSLNDPPQHTSVFDDGYCIYQTPSQNRTNDFTPNSRTFSSMAQDGPTSGNQHPYPFGYSPVMVPGIVHYFPCWLPSWGGWIASWISWISPPWICPSFL